ncbi:MAG: hypothetical protein EHM20_17230 [Alphaproteobacteria bacterium]|nr:MAG: hypothetical protein EHM20_17230 [Alphaproteobacteria bacterium]
MPNASAQGLDLGLEEVGKIVSVESLFPYANLTLILFVIYFGLGIFLFAFFIMKKKKAWTPPVLLQDFPFSAKAAISLGLFAYTLVHVFALMEVYLVTKVSFKSTSEYFFYMKLPKLVATSHAHFFGHGTMYLATSLIFIFSKLKESWKVIFITLALSAGLLDVPSWWAIKYGGSQYEIFSALAGIMSMIGWGFMASRIIYEIWWIEFFGSNK